MRVKCELRKMNNGCVGGSYFTRGQITKEGVDFWVCWGLKICGKLGLMWKTSVGFVSVHKRKRGEW